MAKFYGVVGYAETKEVEPGYWEPEIMERPYYGELLQNSSRLQNPGNVNDDINVANKVSIIADPYATEHFFAIRYVKFHFPQLGGSWKVTNAEVAFPRIILTIGGVWNGEQAGTPE